MSKKQNPKVNVEPDLWIRLNQLKEHGDTFDSVIRRLLDFYEENHKKQ
jgi:hypothetical protein